MTRDWRQKYRDIFVVNGIIYLSTNVYLFIFVRLNDTTSLGFGQVPSRTQNMQSPGQDYPRLSKPPPWVRPPHLGSVPYPETEDSHPLCPGRRSLIVQGREVSRL